MQRSEGQSQAARPRARPACTQRLLTHAGRTCNKRCQGRKGGGVAQLHTRVHSHKLDTDKHTNKHTHTHDTDKHTTHKHTHTTQTNTHTSHTHSRQETTRTRDSGSKSQWSAAASQQMNPRLHTPTCWQAVPHVNSMQGTKKNEGNGERQQTSNVFLHMTRNISSPPACYVLCPWCAAQCP